MCRRPEQSWLISRALHLKQRSEFSWLFKWELGINTQRDDWQVWLWGLDSLYGNAKLASLHEHSLKVWMVASTHLPKKLISLKILCLKCSWDFFVCLFVLVELGKKKGITIRSQCIFFLTGKLKEILLSLFITKKWKKQNADYKTLKSDLS